MKKWSHETWRERIKLILFALTPVTVLVVVCEGLAALAIGRQAEITTDSATGKQTYVFHMGSYPWSHVSKTPINSLGFPDGEFVDLLPKNGCRHIVFLGDSFTFGDGVNLEDSWVSLVRASAKERYPSRCLRFFNLGVRSTTIEQQAEYLEATWNLLEPDLVILGQYQNDLTDFTKWGFAAHDPDTARDGRHNRNSAVRIPMVGKSMFAWLSYQTVALLTQRGIHHDILRRWSVLADSATHLQAERLTGLYATMFDSLVTRVHARHSTVAVIIFPSKFDILAGRFPEERFFQDLARRRNVPSLSLFRALDGARTPYPFLFYDGHFNKLGNVIAAREVSAWLFDGPLAAASRRPSPLRRHLVEPASLDLMRQHIRRSVWWVGFGDIPSERAGAVVTTRLDQARGASKADR